MRRILAAMRRNIENMKKSPKVADENMLGEGNGTHEFPINTRQGRSGLSLLQRIVKAPLTLLSCLSSHPHTTEGVWVSGELRRISDVNHLLVNDSMRYAILM